MNPTRHPEKPPPRGAAAQRKLRACERESRCRAVFFQHWAQEQGLSAQETAERLGLAPRTLAAWNQQLREKRLHAVPRGRPCRRASVARRNEIVAFLRQAGPGLGVPTLQAQFPGVARAELADVLRRFRRVYRQQHRRLLRSLEWQTPGAVWALDHCQAPEPIDGEFPYILNVRDLASGQVLGWIPVAAADAQTTLRLVERLFQEHGPPLVLKSDNGSAFIDGQFQELLVSWKVVALRSPPHTPQYNGSCEAGGGAMKRRTEEQATLDGHPGRWTSADLENALFVANVVLHPHGPKHETPDELWRARAPIPCETRAAFLAELERQRPVARGELSIAADAALSRPQQDRVDRVAIGRTLVEFDLVRFTRRSIAPPLNPQKMAKIR
jgi:transposase InsO family protein